MSNIKKNDEKFIYMPESKFKNTFHTGGTFENWYQTIGRLSIGNSRLIFSIAAALAGPLLKPLGLESGGFNFTGKSSTGKSSALYGAATVWGKGSNIDGFVKNWRATENGLEGLAVQHTDTCLFLDEIGQAPARTIEEASYLLGNGMGKARATKEGNLKPNRTWNLIVLSTGEVGLTQKIKDAGGKTYAGQEVRLIDIPADAGMGMGILENIHDYPSAEAFIVDYKTKFAITDYGHAGRMFVTCLQADYENSIKFVSDYIDNRFSGFCMENASGQVLRVAKRFLLVAAAGELAIRFNIIPWSEGSAYEAAQKCFQAWVEMRGGQEDSEDMEICRRLKAFVWRNWSGRFWDYDRNDLTMPDKGIQAGFKLCKDTGNYIFYIFSEIFETEIFPDKDPKMVAKILLDKGILLKGDNGYKKRFPKNSGLGRPRCYAVRIDDESDDEANGSSEEKSTE